MFTNILASVIVSGRYTSNSYIPVSPESFRVFPAWQGISPLPSSKSDSKGHLFQGNLYPEGFGGGYSQAAKMDATGVLPRAATALQSVLYLPGMNAGVSRAFG